MVCRRKAGIMAENTPPRKADTPEPAPAGSDRLDPVPGLDIPTGIARMAGARDLYFTLVQVLCQDKKDFSEQFQSAIQAGEYKTARRMAHALKGSAGTIVATDLAAAARELEYACRDRDMAAIGAGLEKTAQALDRLTAIAKTLPAAESLPAPPSTSAPVADPVTVRHWLEALIQSLEAADPIQSEDRLRFIEQNVDLCRLSPEAGELAERLRRELAEYRFEQAGEIARTLCRLLREAP